MKHILESLINSISHHEEVSPILFVCESKEYVNQQVLTLSHQLMERFWVDKNFLFQLEDTKESIKIDALRAFISKSYTKSSFRFQIFLIENISRFTLQSAHNSLKFLEEPWDGNLVFLTNQSESNVLDTILSRVQIEYIQAPHHQEKSQFYTQMIDDAIKKKNMLLLWHFFQDKLLTKDEYLLFLSSLFDYCLHHQQHSFLLPHVESSLQNILHNNALPKYEIDGILFQLLK